MPQLYIVDAFTRVPFRGNPAAVCLLSEPLSDVIMQNVAAEMNLSETAFLLREGPRFSLRWFTPKTEVSLCGHATLASAHILYTEGICNRAEDIIFTTRSGELSARAVGSRYELTFPAREVVPADPLDELNEALAVTPIQTSTYRTQKGDLYLLELASEQEVSGLTPDFALLTEADARAVIVTSMSSTDEYDFVSRFFAPRVGISEDPVTGSAHCYLAPYWSRRLKKHTMVGFQASERSGEVSCALDGDRVRLGGDAVTIAKGETCIPLGVS